MATIERSITSSESEKFLNNFFEKYDYLGPKMQNHKKVINIEDTYTLTIDKMSSRLLEELTSDSKVLDVFYNPTHAPPGVEYGINMRYRIYVKYKKVPI